MGLVELPKIGMPRRKLSPEEEEYIKNFWDRIEEQNGNEGLDSFLEELFSVDTFIDVMKKCLKCKHCVWKYDRYLCVIDNMPEFTTSSSVCDRFEYI